MADSAAMRGALAAFGLVLGLCVGAVACVPPGPDEPKTRLGLWDAPADGGPDVGPRADGGAAPDGRVVADASGPDAGVGSDAGAPDAGAASDASGPDASGPDASAPDAGAGSDAGGPDAGVAFDAGVAPDAGAPDAGAPDTGVAPDAGVTPDAGAPRDAGAAIDAGQVDAGSVPITGARAETAYGTRHIYSQLQAWSYDGVYFLTVDVDTSEAVVYHAGTWQQVVRLSRVGHRWISGTRQILMFEDGAGGGAELYAYDLDTGVERRVMGLGHPGLRAGRSHEETSRDGRWVAVYIDQPSSGGPRVVTADLWTGTIGADVSIASLGCGFEPDWVGVDPTGQYLLVQSVADGSGTCQGLWAHDITTGAPVRNLTGHRNHGTTGLGPTGRPYFLSTEISHPQDNGSPGIYRYWIDTGAREVVGAPLPWGALEHVSCLTGAGGPCMASASNAFSTAYTGQIWRLEFSGARTIVEPHNASGCGYWGQPQATVGPGGRFAYTTHGGNCNQIRSVVVQ